MDRAEREIRDILNNNIAIGKWAKKNEKNAKRRILLKEQIAKLKEYESYLRNKPSPRGGRMKPNSIRNALYSLMYLGDYIKKPFEEATQKDLIDFIKSINAKSEYTTSRWKVEYRSFYKWLNGITKPHEFPEVVDHPLLVPERPKNKIRPKDLLTKDEVMRIVNACFDNRTKAMIMTIAEGGLRAGEVVSANVDCVEFDDIGVKFWVEKSKSKERYVRLIDAAPYLERWLNEHPYKEKPEKPLFIGLRAYHGDRLKPKAVGYAIQRAAARAGIKKRVYAHLLRHYAITNISKQGMDTTMNSKRHGITSSTLERVYLHYSDKDVDEAYIRTKGVASDEKRLADEEERQKLAPKKCQYCGSINPFEVHYCEKCNRPIDLKTFVELDEQREKEMSEFKKEMMMMFTEAQKKQAEELSKMFDLDKLLKEKQRRTNKN